MNFDSIHETYASFRRNAYTMNELIERPAIEKILTGINYKYAFDLGCGLGTYTKLLAEKATHVTACDISTRMIDHAKTQLCLTSSNVEFLTTDFRQIPASFYNRYDVVLVSLAIMGELAELLKMSANLLKPGGFIIYTHFHPIYGAGKNNISDRGILIEDYWGRRERKSINPFGTSGEDQYSIKWEYYTIEEHVALLKQSGFFLYDLVEPRPAVYDPNVQLSRRASLFPIIIAIVGGKK